MPDERESELFMPEENKPLEEKAKEVVKLKKRLKELEDELEKDVVGEDNPQPTPHKELLLG